VCFSVQNGKLQKLAAPANIIPSTFNPFNYFTRENKANEIKKTFDG